MLRIITSFLILHVWLPASAVTAVAAFSLALLLPLAAMAQAPAPAVSAWLLTLDGAIGPASADYFIQSLREAEELDVPLVVLRIDTPGGLDQSMRAMVRAILDSRVPVACLVGPAGARAASAGTFILYACHVAAMTPASNLGAASPVAIGGSGANGKQAPSTSERKAMNDAAAYIRTLAAWRGRNAEWAERAVREAATLTAAEALEADVIDLVVSSPEQLLQAIDGRTVGLGEVRRQLTLETAGLRLEPVGPDWRHRFLAVITDPTVAYMLMMAGIYGLLLEFYSPGILIPGVLGGICLLLALYAFQVLPISYSGLGLLLLGVGLMVAEAMAPSFGILGLGGIAAFVMGSILLFDDTVPGMRVALPVILAFAVVSVAAVVFVAAAALRMRRRRTVGTTEEWVGSEAVAVEDFEREGLVRIHGEMWRAISSTPVIQGQPLTVIAVSGNVLTVEAQPAQSQLLS